METFKSYRTLKRKAVWPACGSHRMVFSFALLAQLEFPLSLSVLLYSRNSVTLTISIPS